MAFTYADVMRRASTILQDESATRYSAIELFDWINQALVDVFTMKANAKTGVVQLPLVAGIQQTLPQEYAALIHIRRNTGGAAVKMLDNLTTLDNWLPGWTNPAVLPNAANVQFVYQDPLTPRNYVVVPGSTGSGTLEAVVAQAPSPGVAPTAAADKLDPTKYIANVDLPDQYQTAVLHFALYRAFLKDGDNAASAAQAQAHQAIGAKAISDITANETAMAPGARVTAARRGAVGG